MSTKKHGSEELVNQVLLMGQGRFGFLVWSRNYTLQRRSAEILFEVAKVGCHRVSVLTFMEPSPAPGHRLMNQEKAAALLDSELWSVSMLLLAYAIESLFKVYFVKSGGSLVKDGVLQKKFKTHELRALAENVKLDLPVADLKILDWLTHFLKWRGRYPIPTKQKSYEEFITMRLGSIEEVCTKAFILCDHILQSLNALSGEDLLSPTDPIPPA